MGQDSATVKELVFGEVFAFPTSVRQSSCVFCGCIHRLHACSIIWKIAYVCRSVSIMLEVAIARSSQYALIMASCGEIVNAMNRMMGSSAMANSVMERGHPCLTPDVNVKVWCSRRLRKMVWLLLE